jgi:hypothetical protein
LQRAAERELNGEESEELSEGRRRALQIKTGVRRGDEPRWVSAEQNGNLHLTCCSDKLTCL